MKHAVDTTPSSPSGCGQVAGKGFGTLFFGLFLLMGSLFTILVSGAALEQAAPWWWSETECTILSSSIGDTGNDRHPYRAVVRYRYEFNGHTYENDTLFSGGGGTSSFDRARDRAARYQPGVTATCRVDPENPAGSVLERRVPWITLVVFFPLIFVAIGAVGLVATWRRTPKRDDGTTDSISQTAGAGRGYRLAVGLGLVFVVVGGALFVSLFALPAERTAESLTWEGTPCTVVRARLRSWSTDDGTSYRADVLYEYSAGGRSWRSNRVDFFSALSSGRGDARSVLERHPTGADGTCWVDPDNPARSVLERGVRPRHFLGLLPLIFLIAGAAVTRWGLKQLRGHTAAEEPGFETEADIEGSLVLEPQLSPVGKLFGTIFFALFWNGIVSIFVFQAFKAWQQGHPDWFLSIFMVPFVLVGVAAIAFAGYFALALANPRPRLTMAKGTPYLGDELRIDWRFKGRASRINHLRIFLEGREEATYQRGTDTITEREIFATHDLVDTGDAWRIPQGAAEFVIPADTMHSFDAPGNKIIWEIKVAGEILRWPDVDQNFPITIKPPRIEDLQW